MAMALMQKDGNKSNVNLKIIHCDNFLLPSPSNYLCETLECYLSFSGNSEVLKMTQ